MKIFQYAASLTLEVFKILIENPLLQNTGGNKQINKNSNKNKSPNVTSESNQHTKYIKAQIFLPRLEV